MAHNAASAAGAGADAPRRGHGRGAGVQLVEGGIIKWRSGGRGVVKELQGLIQRANTGDAPELASLLEQLRQCAPMQPVAPLPFDAVSCASDEGFALNQLWDMNEGSTARNALEFVGFTDDGVSEACDLDVIASPPPLQAGTGMAAGVDTISSTSLGVPPSATLDMNPSLTLAALCDMFRSAQPGADLFGTVTADTTAAGWLPPTVPQQPPSPPPTPPPPPPIAHASPPLPSPGVLLTLSREARGPAREAVDADADADLAATQTQAQEVPRAGVHTPSPSEPQSQTRTHWVKKGDTAGEGDAGSRPPVLQARVTRRTPPPEPEPELAASAAAVVEEPPRRGVLSIPSVAPAASSGKGSGAQHPSHARMASAVAGKGAGKKGGKGSKPTVRIAQPHPSGGAAAAPPPRFDTTNIDEFPTLGAAAAQQQQHPSQHGRAKPELKIVYRGVPNASAAVNRASPADEASVRHAATANAAVDAPMRITVKDTSPTMAAVAAGKGGKGRKGAGGSGKGAKGGEASIAPPIGILQAVGKKAPRPTHATPGAFAAKPAPPMAGLWYSQRLWSAVQPYSAMATHVLAMEKVFQELIEKHPTAKMLPPMRKEKRAIVHELALYYNLHVESLDPEPHRSCLVTTLPNSRPPPQLLSAWAKTARHPTAAADAHMNAHPHHAVVFPGVPADATLGYFNELLAKFAGRYLIVRTRKDTGEKRDCIVVCFDDDTIAAVTTLLTELAAKRKCRYPWMRYADQDDKGCVDRDDGPASSSAGATRSNHAHAPPANAGADWRVTQKGPAPQTLVAGGEKLPCSNTFRGLMQNDNR